MNLFIFIVIDVIVSVAVVWIFNIFEQRMKEQEQKNNEYKDKEHYTIDDLRKKMEQRRKEQENKGEDI